MALIVRALACLAEGLGIRATQLHTFSRSLLCDMHVKQL
jgi:hypothetical protein